jgi:hypothetical protein
MKILVLFVVYLSILTNTISSEERKNSTSNSLYFPANSNKTLVYLTSFGESSTKYTYDNGLLFSSNEGEKFTYRQKLLITNDGVYVKETYQYLKIFLFIKKEATYSYNRPLMRLPLPLTPGTEWNWTGIEYCNGDSSGIKVSGKVFNKEMIITKAGNFESIKVETVIDGSSNSKNTITEWFAENIGLVKAVIILDGSGLMGLVKNILGYGKIEFELKEIRNN